MAVNKNLLVLGLFMTTLVWTAALGSSDSRVHIWILGGKNYASLIIRSKEGKFALVNPTSSSTLLAKLGERMPFYEHQIDLVVLTKGQSREILDGLKQHYQIGKVWGSSDQGSVTKDNKNDQFGESSLDWSAAFWQIFTLPKEEGVVRFSEDGSSLLFITKQSEAVWQSVPDWGPVTEMVGPWKNSGSSPQTLLTKFKPVKILSSSTEGEIVW